MVKRGRDEDDIGDFDSVLALVTKINKKIHINGGVPRQDPGQGPSGTAENGASSMDQQGGEAMNVGGLPQRETGDDLRVQKRSLLGPMGQQRNILGSTCTIGASSSNSQTSEDWEKIVSENIIDAGTIGETTNKQNYMTLNGAGQAGGPVESQAELLRPMAGPHLQSFEPSTIQAGGPVVSKVELIRPMAGLLLQSSQPFTSQARGLMVSQVQLMRPMAGPLLQSSQPSTSQARGLVVMDHIRPRAPHLPQCSQTSTSQARGLIMSQAELMQPMAGRLLQSSQPPTSQARGLVVMDHIRPRAPHLLQSSQPSSSQAQGLMVSQAELMQPMAGRLLQSPQTSTSQADIKLKLYSSIKIQRGVPGQNPSQGPSGVGEQGAMGGSSAQQGRGSIIVGGPPQQGGQMGRPMEAMTQQQNTTEMTLSGGGQAEGPMVSQAGPASSMVELMRPMAGSNSQSRPSNQSGISLASTSQAEPASGMAGLVRPMAVPNSQSSQPSTSQAGGPVLQQLHNQMQLSSQHFLEACQQQMQQLETQMKDKSKRDIQKTITEDLLEVFECPVCAMALDEEHCLCCRGHAVCGGCRAWLTQCPTCQGEFVIQRSILINKAVELLQRLA